MPRERRTVGLPGVVGILAATLALGFALKVPCADEDAWADGRAARIACYTDVTALYVGRDLDDGVPYLDRPFEYPVGTGIPVAIAATLAGSSTSFFLLNAASLTVAAVVATVALFRVVGQRALYLAAAPTLVLSAFLNWDLFAVALASLGIASFLRGRPLTGGAWLGLGAATKVFPGLLVPPLALDRWREDRAGAARLVAAAAATWIAVNVPIALIAPGRWLFFYRYSSSREPTIESIWFLACRLTGGDGTACWSPALVNVLSAILVVAGTVLLWWLRSRRDPGAATWTVCFPLVVLFLLTNKVYSPQYALFLLPLFATAFPNLRLFLLFEAVDVVGFVTRFAYLRTTLGFDGLPRWTFEAAAAARMVVFVVLLIAWARSSDRDRASADARSG